ncbi:hypothetical protein [Streptomyces pristinaespiralis]|uniref:hypothetical protein n=1 Tax=Streptomyces pristinaespiralis TaxID=38300 RepID=UPI0033C8091C
MISPTELCGKEARKGRATGPVRAQTPMCEEHAAVTYNHNARIYRTELLESMNAAGLDTNLPGWAYIIWLPNGRIKIGWSGGDDLLVYRWKMISKDWRRKGYADPVRPIAILPGGAGKEGELHERFHEFRVETEYGEQFRTEPELIAYAEMYGIPEDKAHLVTRFEEQWAKGEVSRKVRLEKKQTPMKVDPWDTSKW